MTSCGFSVALNVFWRSHHYAHHSPRAATDGRSSSAAAKPSAMYDPKDLYGNRDPPAGPLVRSCPPPCPRTAPVGLPGPSEGSGRACAPLSAA